MRKIEYSIERGELHYLDPALLPEQTQEKVSYRKLLDLPIPVITPRALLPTAAKAPDADIAGTVFSMIGISIIVGVVVGAMSNATAGLIVGLALATFLVVAAIRGHPNAKQQLAEHNRREFHLGDYKAMRSCTQSLTFPRGFYSGRDSIANSVLRHPQREDQLLDMIDHATRLKSAIVSTESWRTAYLDAHRGVFSPSADERQFIQHAITLLIAYQKLGAGPEGDTSTALMAGEAYDRAIRPLDLVRDRLVERLSALDSYHRHLLALDTELENAATARRAVSVDDDLLELFQNTVGDEFATAQLNNLTENAKAMSGAVNELVDALNRDLHTLVALAPPEKNRSTDTQFRTVEPQD